MALKVKVAFGLNESGPSSDMPIQLANWFSADPLVEVFFDPSTHNLCIRAALKKSKSDKEFF